MDTREPLFDGIAASSLPEFPVAVLSESQGRAGLVWDFHTQWTPTKAVDLKTIDGIGRSSDPFHPQSGANGSGRVDLPVAAPGRMASEMRHSRDARLQKCEWWGNTSGGNGGSREGVGKSIIAYGEWNAGDGAPGNWTISQLGTAIFISATNSSYNVHIFKTTCIPCHG